MLHMVTCSHYQPLWNACELFCVNVLGEPRRPRSRVRGIILNLREGTTPLAEPSRALMRHAVEAHYMILTKVNMEGRRYCWELAFHITLSNYADALRAYAYRMKLQSTQRTHAHLQEHFPEEALQRFSPLISINRRGVGRLTHPLQQAMQQAEAAKKRALNQN